MTQIRKEYPPNFHEVKYHFPSAANYGVVFAYAPDIYAPHLDSLQQEIVAHEMAHIERQELIGVKEWWNKYLTDREFRYTEELIAHRAELAKLLEMTPTRQVRRSAPKHVAKKLIAPLYKYGREFTMERALNDLLLHHAPIIGDE